MLMERMMASDREIHILTGHMGSGKSRYFKLLGDLPEYKEPTVLRIAKDSTFVRYFGYRVGKSAEDNQRGYLTIYDLMTARERTYTDELLRVDAERALVIGTHRKVLIDAAIRSQIVTTAKKIESLTNLIEKEKAAKLGLLPPDPPSRVHLRIVFLFCDFDTIRRRMAERWPYLRLNSNELPVPLINTLSRFKLPRFSFFAVNNSDENPETDAVRFDEIRRFFAGHQFSHEFIATRREQARRCLAANRKEVKKFIGK